jgi:hypothetical protein
VNQPNYSFHATSAHQLGAGADEEPAMLPSFNKCIEAGRLRSVLVRRTGDLRRSYLPPLTAYFAAGVSRFTGIIEAFL